MNLIATLALAPAPFLQGISMHGMVPLAFCVFLVFQLYLYFRCWWGLARQRKVLTELCAEKRVPEQSSALAGTGEGWLSWVASRFHDGAFQDGHYTRDDAMEHLDGWLESKESYLVLQRMGIVAPMVGVLLTVAAFLSLDLPTADWSLTEIFQMISRIMLGVGSGAALTAFNHFLLHVVGKKTDVVRSAACRWFDECIWRNVQVKPHEVTNNVTESLQEMSTTIRASVAEYRNATAAIAHTSQMMQSAGVALVDTVERFRSDTANIPEEMKGLRSTANSVIRSLSEIVPNIERTTSELAESVVAFRSVVQDQFGQAAARHQQSAELLTGSVDQIRESAARLSRQFDSFGQIVDAQATASQEWSRSLHDNVLPAQRAFQQAGTQFTEATKDLAPAQRAFREAAELVAGIGERFGGACP